MARRAANTCTVTGCHRKHWAKGYCSAHYQRVRKGEDLNTPIEAGKGDRLRWLKAHLEYAGAACLVWPFSSDPSGYGSGYYAGRKIGAHRLMCVLAHGEPPVGNSQAAHSCGNKSCVNPKHLRWATGAQNADDKRRHGTMPYGERVHSSRMTVADVRRAKAMRSDGASYQKISELIGVSRSTVSRACKGETWANAD